MTVSYAGTAVDHTPTRLGFLATLAPYLHTLLRVGAGLLFMQHGLQKLFGMFGGMGGPGGTVSLTSKFGVAGIIEFGGGALITLGFLTRPVAFIAMVEMLVAYTTVHAAQGGLPIQNKGELALLYALVWAFLVGRGAGPLSIDAAISRSRRP